MATPHGANGKANDKVRFDLGILAFFDVWSIFFPNSFAVSFPMRSPYAISPKVSGR